jgi:L-fuconolactonase
MKIDSHQHFWKYNSTEYAWIDETMSVLKRDFLPPDLEQELKTVNFDGSIAVQARQSLEETRWLLKLSSRYSFIKGVVGWVDLCSPDIENQLKEFSNNRKLAGVRHVVHDEPDDRFMARKDFKNGIRLLAKYNLTYDILIFTKHLPLATELVAEFPKQKFVLDHVAKPFIKDQIISPWNRDIEKLAKHLNVYCKLSGMVTEANWKNWKKTDFRDYLDTVFHAFGPDRLMIGSDWPVCRVAGSYLDVLNSVIDYLKQFDSNDQEKITGLNANNFYLKK